MQELPKDRLQRLCEAAAKELDDEKLLELVQEINQLIEQKSAPLASAADQK